MYLLFPRCLLLALVRDIPKENLHPPEICGTMIYLYLSNLFVFTIPHGFFFFFFFFSPPLPWIYLIQLIFEVAQLLGITKTDKRDCGRDSGNISMNKK